MNRLSYKIGFRSAQLLSFTFVVWIVCFIGIATSSPLFYWTNLSDYITYFQSNGQYLQNIAKFFMLLFGPLYVLLINSYFDYAAENKKVLVRISLLFGLAFALLSSIHYFVQLTTVRLNIEQGNFDGLGHLVQANPYSVMSSINMLGWTFFLGLSSFFIFPVFKGDRLNKIIGYAFLFNGISCFSGGVGYLFHIDLLTFIFMNLGLGGAVMTFSITSISLFKQLKTS
jgi:hypothetical protein